MPSEADLNIARLASRISGFVAPLRVVISVSISLLIGSVIAYDSSSERLGVGLFTLVLGATYFVLTLFDSANALIPQIGILRKRLDHFSKLLNHRAELSRQQVELQRQRQQIEVLLKRLESGRDPKEIKELRRNVIEKYLEASKIIYPDTNGVASDTLSEKK
jgi:hypothetical protein